MYPFIFLVKPQLVPTEEQIITTEGYNATIRCEVWGARPEANISLSFNGEETTDHRSVHNQSSDTYTTVVETSRVMERTYNGKHVSCIISHLALPIPVNRTWTTIVYCKHLLVHAFYDFSITSSVFRFLTLPGN